MKVFLSIEDQQREKSRKYINPLLISIVHECLIKSISRPLSSQTSEDKKVKECYLSCLNHFSSKEKLAYLKEHCSRNEAVKRGQIRVVHIRYLLKCSKRTSRIFIRNSLFAKNLKR